MAATDGNESGSENEILLNGEATTDSTTMGEVNNNKKKNRSVDQQETLYVLLHHLIASIISPDPQTSLFQRIKNSVQDIGPRLPEATRVSLNKLLVWTRQGSPLRALLVISVGSIILLAVTGLLVFMVFFLVATISAVFMSLLVSLAVAGGFLAMFFACIATVYVGALLTAVFVISTATISTITVSLIATGWIGFFWTVWLITKKSMGIAKHSLSITGSTLLAYSTSRQGRRLKPDKAYE